MTKEKIRNALILIYMLGSALSFNALLKAERAAMAADQSWTSGILKILFLAAIWPVYWLLSLFT